MSTNHTTETAHVADRLLAEGADVAVDVAKRLGVNVSGFTILRWILNGVDGVQLEAFRAGRVWHTSEAAVRRFLRARTDASLGGQASQAPASVRRDAAKARLRARGLRA